MIVFKKAKSKEEASRVRDFIETKGYDAEIEKNDGFMSDKYPYEVVGENALSSAMSPL
jgi:diphthamide synthase subunit DPH2